MVYAIWLVVDPTLFAMMLVFAKIDEANASVVYRQTIWRRRFRCPCACDHDACNDVFAFTRPSFVKCAADAITYQMRFGRKLQYLTDIPVSYSPMFG